MMMSSDSRRRAAQYRTLSQPRGSCPHCGYSCAYGRSIGEDRRPAGRPVYRRPSDCRSVGLERLNCRTGKCGGPPARRSRAKCPRCGQAAGQCGGHTVNLSFVHCRGYGDKTQCLAPTGTGAGDHSPGNPRQAGLDAERSRRVRGDRARHPHCLVRLPIPIPIAA